MKQIIFITILIFAFCCAAFAQADENSCPKIKLHFPNWVVTPDEPIALSAELIQNTAKLDVEYIWSVSSGKIISGQGTSEIKFIASKYDNGSNIKATIKIKGLPEKCSNTVSDLFPVLDTTPSLEPFYAVGKSKPTKEGLWMFLSVIDNYMVSLSDNSPAEGLITIDFNKKDNQSYKLSHIKKIYKQFVFRKFDLTRITFAISKDVYDVETTAFWIFELEADFPKSVNENYRIIKAEEFEQNIGKLFPLKTTKEKN